MATTDSDPCPNCGEVEDFEHIEKCVCGYHDGYDYYCLTCQTNFFVDELVE